MKTQTAQSKTFFDIKQYISMEIRTLCKVKSSDLKSVQASRYKYTEPPRSTTRSSIVELHNIKNCSKHFRDLC